MSEFKEKARQLSPDIYRQFKKAIEVGKWPDGRRLGSEQREIVLEAIILYENAHLPEEERTGHIADACKSVKSVDDTQNITIKH